MKYFTLSCDEEKLKGIKALLMLYRHTLHGVSYRLDNLDGEVFAASRRHLSDIVDGIICFDNQKNEDKFYDRLYTCHDTLELLKLLEKALVIMKDYPDDGDRLFKMLEKLYFYASTYTNDELMEELDLPRTTYYRYLKKAYVCFYFHLIGVLKNERKQLDEEAFEDLYA